MVWTCIHAYGGEWVNEAFIVGGYFSYSKHGGANIHMVVIPCQLKIQTRKMAKRLSQIIAKF